MTENELTRQRVSQQEMSGIIQEEELLPLYVRGLHGGSNFITAINVDGSILSRQPYEPITGTPEESVDELMMRARRDIVPFLPETALRDSQGRAIGYFIYRGLPDNYCAP